MNVVCRRDKMYKNHTAPIHVRFTLNRKSRYVSTGFAIDPEDWDFENQQVKTQLFYLKEVQHQINSLILDYERKIKRLEVLEIEVSLDTLLEKNNRKANCTLFDCFEREIERLKSLGKHGSASKHESALSLLKQFRSTNIRLEEIDLVYLNDFELFLRKRGNKDNSIATKFAIFKAVYNKAIAEELFIPKSNPFTKFKVGRLWTETRKRSISKEDIQKLVDLRLPKSSTPYLEFARDIFLFTYYTAGINIGDIARLKHSNIRNGRINYTRHKTGKEIACKLMPIASEIIEKYSSPFYDDVDYIFPILDKQHATDLQIHNRIHKVTVKVNKRLKELAKLAGIEVHLTTYVARHTYATVLKRSGVNIAIISESLGHSDLATTQIYLDSFENSQIDEAMQNLL